MCVRLVVNYWRNVSALHSWGSYMVADGVIEWHMVQKNLNILWLEVCS